MPFGGVSRACFSRRAHTSAGSSAASHMSFEGVSSQRYGGIDLLLLEDWRRRGFPERLFPPPLQSFLQFILLLIREIWMTIDLLPQLFEDEPCLHVGAHG